MTVDISARARTVGIDTTFKNLRGGNILFLPQRIAVIGQGSTGSTYSTTKAQVTSAFAVGQTYGFGSPLHLAAKQLFPANGDGVGTIPVTVYPLVDAGSSVAATGAVTPSGSATEAGAYRVSVNNILSQAFTISAGDSVAAMVTAMAAAINANLDMPVTAVDNTTDVQLTSKWKGVSANGISVSIVGPTDLGVTFAITAMSGGLVNPSVQTALDQIGDTWETLLLNCLDAADTVAFGALSTFGEGRWGALSRRPLVALTGNSATTVTAATTVTDARKTDRVNSQLVAPGSKDLPFVIAARQLSRIAVRANEDPARDYGSLAATGLTPGADGDQWDYTQRDQALKAGSSSIKIKDGVINLADIVTFYHPDGDEDPAYRYVVDIVKLQNILYNVDALFDSPEWDGAPLLPDGQVFTSRSAKTPSMAKAALAQIANGLAEAAIISDLEFTLANMQAAISDQNPKRLDVVFPVKLSGNANIISVDLEFGFFFN